MENLSSSPEEFHAILSTMRSGTSLCGHLLAEAGWIRYAGETQTKLVDESGVLAARAKILQSGVGTNPAAPLCDKVLAPGLLPDGGRFLVARADRIYLLLRHPLAIWRSGKPKDWPFFQLNGLARQLAFLRRVVVIIPREKLVVMSYYDLTSSEKRKELFGREIEEYTLSAHAGKPGWGDPSGLIRSGKIRELTLQEDVERAMGEVGEDVGHPDFIRAMEEYRGLLKSVRRLDLDFDRSGLEG